MDDALITSLSAAVEAAPGDLTLRLQLADLLVAAGRGPEAEGPPGHGAGQRPGVGAGAGVEGNRVGPPGPATEAAPAADDPGAGNAPDATLVPSGHPSSVDWASLEADLGDAVPPMFADGSTDGVGSAPDAWETERIPPATPSMCAQGRQCAA